MTRRYARAPRGVRVHETTPEGNWKILTTKHKTLSGVTGIRVTHTNHTFSPSLDLSKPVAF